MNVNIVQSEHWSLLAIKLKSYELGHQGSFALDLSYLTASENTLEYLEFDVDQLVLNLLTKYGRLEKVDIIANGIEMRRPGAVALHRSLRMLLSHRRPSSQGS